MHEYTFFIMSHNSCKALAQQHCHTAYWFFYKNMITFALLQTVYSTIWVFVDTIQFTVANLQLQSSFLVPCTGYHVLVLVLCYYAPWLTSCLKPVVQNTVWCTKLNIVFFVIHQVENYVTPGYSKHSPIKYHMVREKPCTIHCSQQSQCKSETISRLFHK